MARKLLLVRQLADQAYAEYLGQNPRPEHLLRVVQINVFHALARNAAALGLSTLWLLCESISPLGQIGPPTPLVALPPSYPDSLAPTPLQATELHHPWIDLLPWPVLRDRILRLCSGNLIDEDDLCHDIVEFDTSQGSDKAALIVWGAPWDPKGWEASPAFLRKWGWLLENCAEILEATNYWREKRGEQKLSFRPWQSACRHDDSTCVVHTL
jgi:hypothetical protein